MTSESPRESGNIKITVDAERGHLFNMLTEVVAPVAVATVRAAALLRPTASGSAAPPEQAKQAEKK